MSGRIRVHAEDFVVDEIPLFEPAGEGDHVMLLIRKRGLNTREVAGRLARQAGVPIREVGFAGLKDRVAVTTQWFSLHLPDDTGMDWEALDGDDLQVLARRRHRWKLQRGDLKGNRFRLLVRELAGDEARLASLLEAIRRNGVPNYFGEQRFGRDCANLVRAQSMFAGEYIRDRHLRGLYLSAARSFLFNMVLSRRVELACWDAPLPGDALMLADSGVLSATGADNPDTTRRVANGELHPTGPLWGKGFVPVSGEAARLEREILAAFSGWRKGLERAGMKHQRRPLRVIPGDLQAARNDDSLTLSFSLPAGAYATAVLRELFDYRASRS